MCTLFDALLTRQPCVLELGGKAPFVVLPSANLDLAASGAVFGGYLHSGQICMSTDVVLVHESVEDEFHAHLARRAQNLTAGADAAPLKGLFSERSAQRLDGFVKDALQKGAKVLAGKAEVKGNVMQPLILAGIKDDMKVADEESFGPLITVRTFKTEAEAIELANRSGALGDSTTRADPAQSTACPRRSTARRAWTA